MRVASNSLFRSHPNVTSFTLALVLLLLATAAFGQTQSGKLAFTVIVVDELVAKPVPLADFQIITSSANAAEQTVRTDEQGSIP